jgi:hypothetical protein
MRPMPLWMRLAIPVVCLLLMTGCHWDFPRMRMPDPPRDRDIYREEPMPPDLALARPNPHAGGPAVPGPEPLL